MKCEKEARENATPDFFEVGRQNLKYGTNFPDNGGDTPPIKNGNMNNAHVVFYMTGQ